MMKPEEESFHFRVKSELQHFLDQNAEIYTGNNIIRMDLHCHDYNSNVPDEILGRILNVPETWLPTKKLLRTLKKNGMDVFTITNHNNARSCFELLDKGHDILVGAEFSCVVPDYQVGIHVLTYGFTPSQEVRLNRLRKDVYAFIDFANEQNLPVVWAHPLYHYTKGGSPPMEFFNKMALVFERFEVINGQRDTWQNMLVKRWVESLSPEKISSISAELDLDPGRFCKEPFRKQMAGGSDSHMGIFSGLTGVQLFIPDLGERRKAAQLSELALEAIRDGRMLPFGGHNNSEKMMVAFLDYACQITLNSKDPGLVRILLHKGEPRQKITALVVSNAFAELRRHRVTMSFIKLFHESLTGNAPSFTRKLFMPAAYKPIFDETLKMAKVFRNDPSSAPETYARSIGLIYGMLCDILDKSLTVKFDSLKKKKKQEPLDLNRIISGFEMPSVLRSYITDSKQKRSNDGKSGNAPDLAAFLDGLSFPLLTNAVILGAHFTSARVMYNTRPMLREFSDELGCLQHPKRMLWLSDTWNDKNGVSMVLKAYLTEIQKNNLPIDIMVCSQDTVEEDHLIVVKPQSELEIPFYRDQKIRIPNLLEIHHKFLDGEYDRVICSTEGVMGLAALYIKQAYSVPAFFYLHSDWKTFTRKVLGFDRENQNRFIRLIRAFYKEFDGVFVLNNDHYNWLTSKKMALKKESVFQTAHWPGDQYKPLTPDKPGLFNIDRDIPVLLFAGRLSIEKGVMDLPEIYSEVKKSFPDVRMVIAGSGPAKDSLKTEMPDAIFLGWIDPSILPAVYSSASLLVLPSRFDTFSCVVIEAMSCGLPVIAYNCKGPKDIIQNGINGYLVSDKPEMIEGIKRFFSDRSIHKDFAEAALKRSTDYQAEPIVDELLSNVGLSRNLFPHT